jgi:alpha-glucosidase (family GH31 glycosyl hydrolase)
LDNLESRMTLPKLLRVEGRSVQGEAHPALADPHGEGWQDWKPPSEGWIPAHQSSRSETDGTLLIVVESTNPDACVRATFERSHAERFWGFGERSNKTEHSGSLVEHWVGEGPYQLEEYPLIEAITPRWAIRRRRDATYFPIPWLLSSRGYGVLTESNEWSCHDLAGEATWSVIVWAGRLVLRLFDTATPAGALARFTHLTGRQPMPAAAWFLGPWIHTGQADLVPLETEQAILESLHEHGAPVAAVETHMRRLPGGAHIGRRNAERARTAEFHRRGLHSMTYLSPTVSRDFSSVFDAAASAGAFEKHPDGTPWTFDAYIGGREPPVTVQAQLDFTSGAAVDIYRRLIDEAIADGHDGWMEDFGEYSPLLAEHNLYPLRYHRAASDIATTLGQSPARMVRSGWTGSARYSPLVWGGDPTTCWGFDGLRSAVIEGLTMGLSGVAFWGSDIGGFFSLGAERLTPELLIRWIQLGALSPLMRTKAGGVAIGPATRPQIWDPEILPHWRRWAAFHNSLIPYLLEAAGEYSRTGMPLMRHHVLTDPADFELASLDDQYLLGADILVAPVLVEGQRERSIRLPAGRWIDLWRSVDVAADGSMSLRSANVLEGGRAHLLPAPLEEIPLLMREGARIAGLDFLF